MRNPKILLPAVVLAVALLAAGAVPLRVLQVAAVKQERVLLTRRVAVGDTFSTRFIHSVERCPVEEFFRIDAADRFVLFEATFAYSSVGLPYRGFGREVFTVEKDGYRLANMHREIPAIVLWVNDRYDNTLTLEGEAIKLFSLAGNTLLKISVERPSLLAYFIQTLNPMQVRR